MPPTCYMKLMCSSATISMINLLHHAVARHRIAPVGECTPWKRGLVTRPVAFELYCHEYCLRRSALFRALSWRSSPPENSATSRLLLHKNVRKPIVDKILEVARKVSVGDPLRGDNGTPIPDGTPMGPLVSGAQRDKVLGFISRVSGSHFCLIQYHRKACVSLAAYKGTAHLHIRSTQICIYRHVRALCQCPRGVWVDSTVKVTSIEQSTTPCSGVYTHICRIGRARNSTSHTPSFVLVARA